MGAFTEQQTRERLVSWFIDQDPVMIPLSRPVKIWTAAGGTINFGTVELPPQRFYFYPFTRRFGRGVKYNPQSYGEDRVEYAEYVLIFMKDIDIKEGDLFVSPVGLIETLHSMSLESGESLGLEDFSEMGLELLGLQFARARLDPGWYEINFVSPRRWDRGQAGLLYRGEEWPAETI